MIQAGRAGRRKPPGECLKLAETVGSEFALPPNPGPHAGRECTHTPKPRSICIYLEGAPSQIDLFDPKPKLAELHGQKLPESFTKNVRFAFLQKETHINDLHATIMHLFGIDHLKLTYEFQGRDFRLTDVGGKVVKKLLA